MLVRLHVHAKDEDECKVHLTPFIEKFDIIVEKVTSSETEEYLKFEEMFEVLYECKLHHSVTYADLRAVLQTVSIG
ncbi:hypothetical protein ABE28_019950 [Peribacillus muralis]|uniref:Uncharacterized protein n=1 Tax=Peribacillus muralis TaxID=264697 RepID=A0A1B3XTV3_9BACI|nr:hypothetical protein [Peribacillus muralis]AOH56647.1 hypothetical protein ABE28_019950 [Peribacillus muralis]